MKDKCDAVITLDADLQDDIEVLDAFIREFQKGSEIVYGVRSSRLVDHLFKRLSAEGFYRLMKKLGVELIYNHADYRLVSRRALEELEKYKEVNLFLRGIMPRLGFQTSIVRYERKERLAGKSKYPLKKDGGACRGRGDFLQQQTTFVSDGIGILDFDRQPAFYACHEKREPEHPGVNLGGSRDSACGGRDPGRIYRKDLSGDQGKTQVYRGEKRGGFPMIGDRLSQIFHAVFLALFAVVVLYILAGEQEPFLLLALTAVSFVAVMGIYQILGTKNITDQRLNALPQ